MRAVGSPLGGLMRFLVAATALGVALLCGASIGVAADIGATEAWKLAAYVRTLAGLTPMDARPSREDNTSYTTSLMLKHREDPKQSFIPPSAERP